MRGIADTGFIVAFGNRHDRHHAWAVDVATRVTPPLLTCEAVAAEAAFHLDNASYVLALFDEGLLRLAFNAADHLDALTSLANRYAARRPDLANLCVIRMSELFPRHEVVTTDRDDFRVYRRNKREMIPLVCPQG